MLTQSATEWSSAGKGHRIGEGKFPPLTAKLFLVGFIDFQREVAAFKIEFGNYLGRFFFFRFFRDADAVKKEGLRCHQTQRNPCCRFSAARSVVLVVVGLGVVSFL